MVDATPRNIVDLDASLIELRRLLAGPSDDRIEILSERVDHIDRQISDDELLVARLIPIFDLLMRRMVRDHRDLLVEALHPVIGALISRAVREAIANLAERIDAQARRATDVRRIGWRLRAKLGGADAAEMALRERLPFAVEEVLLVHRESGLLLRHEAVEPEAATERDLLAGMLTAIRSFAEQAFGVDPRVDAEPGRGEQLDEIQFGERRILLEADRHAVLAVVVDGVEPPEFRETMRRSLRGIRESHGRQLKEFEGDIEDFADVTHPMDLLLAARADEVEETGGRGETMALAGAALLLAALACSSFWALRLTVAALMPSPSPTPVTVVVTATPRPTSTFALPSATPRPTSTVVPLAEPRARTLGNVWLRSRPEDGESWKLGTVGRNVRLTLLGRAAAETSDGESVERAPLRWLYVRLIDQDIETIDGVTVDEGWMARRWIDVDDEAAAELPARIVPVDDGS